MTNLVGIHQLLVAIPVWILAPLLYLATDGVIHFLRDKREGFGYQTSWSAKYGDLCLLSVVLMVATNLHDGTYVPMWLHFFRLQVFLLIACVVIGIGVCIATIQRRSGDLPLLSSEISTTTLTGQ